MLIPRQIRSLCWILVAVFLFTGRAWAQSDINLTGYTLTFDEEFNSLSLTTANPKGSATWFAGPANGAPGYFSNSNWNINAFSVSGGILSDTAYYANPAVGGQNWQSGLISSVDPSVKGFSQLYGYFEIRCQMPNAGQGAWPSFWLDSTSGISGGQNEEIDVFEWYGVTNTPSSYSDYIQQASHNWNSDGSQNTSLPYLYSPQTNMPGGQYPWQGYHIYGCQIDPVHITWYIDGTQTNQIATPTAYLTTPFYLMVDYALGGGWSLTGTPFTTDGSSSLLVDWVRVYQLPSGTTTYALTVNSGSGSGNYAAGTAVTVTANAAPSGYQFSGWSGATSALANPAAASTTLTMPAAATSITANYTPTSGSSTPYQDAFSRSGELNGTSPNPSDTGGATWAVSIGTGQYSTNGSVATITNSGYPYSAACLPVNGSSGVVLDGTKNFTLSVVLTSGSTGLAGIALSTGLAGTSYSNLFTNNLATLVTSSSFLGAYSYNGGNIYYNYGPGISGPTTISLAYNASAGTLTFTVGSSVLLTQSGVTASQIAALQSVAFGNDGYGNNAAAPAPTFDNFTLAVGSGGATTYALTVNSGSGSGNYAAGTGVTVTANAPANGYHFVSWTGATSALANASAATTTLTMPAAATSITATYAANATYALTVNSGSGGGNYAAGTVVTVTANAAPTGYQFSGWTGATSALANPSAASTTLTMPAAATSITANYSPTSVYQDAFSRSGELVGTTPSPSDKGGAGWSSTTGTGQYTTNGSVATIPSSAYPYSAAFLPVNGSSGVVLDGTKNFTLSVLLTSGSTGLTGISLNTALSSNNYGNLFTNNLATLVTSSGFLGAYSYNGGNIYYNYGPGISGATTISLAYNAAAATLTFTVGGSVLLTQSGVTASQIAALRAVAFGNDGYGSGSAAPAPTFDNFTLTVSP